MLIGIEGADRSGKTSLLQPLASALGAIPITRLETSKDTAKCWPWIEPVYLHLLEQLYWPSLTYVTDRSMTVSAQVYAAVFNRPVLFDPAPWRDREVVVYVETPLSVLNQRWHEEGGNEVFPLGMYQRVLEEYERVLKDYRVVRVSGVKPMTETIRFLLGALSVFRRPIVDFIPGSLGRLGSGDRL